MSERINISIPGELHERLSHFKDKLNMSRICQKAINHAVRIEEIKTEKASDMDSLVERLKEEELRHAQKYIDEGFKWGAKDAYGLSLNSFLEIETWGSDNYDWHDHSGPFIPSKETVKALKEFDERSGSMSSDERGQLADEYPGLGYALEPKNYFVRGWMDGVIYIWNQVKHKLIGLQQEPNFLKIVCDDDDN